MLTFVEFAEKAASAPYVERPYNIHSDSDLGRDDVFFACWVVGGMTGGSCWNSGACERIEPEDEPEIEGMMLVLEAAGVRPRDVAAFLGLVQRGEHDSFGYYGNCTYYGYKYVGHDEVYAKMVELGYAEPRHEEGVAP